MNEAKNRLRRGAPIIFRDDESMNRKKIHSKISVKGIDFLRSN